MESEAAIVIEDLTVAYDVKPVLWDIDLEIQAGTLTAVIGPNGAGKTTLLKAILGLVKPISGSIKFPTKTASAGKDFIAYVPQNGSVDRDFPVNVLDVVMMAGMDVWDGFGVLEKRIGRRRWKRCTRSEWKNTQNVRSISCPAVSSSASSWRALWFRTRIFT